MCAVGDSSILGSDEAVIKDITGNTGEVWAVDHVKSLVECIL